MAKIYKGNPLRVNFTIKEELTDNTFTVIDISGLTVKVYYRKPDGTSGSVSGTVVSGPAGTMYGNITDTLNNVAGRWTFWPSVVFGADEYEGEPIYVDIYEIGY